MPFNGSGTFTFTAGSFNPAVNGANATAADFNALSTDAATAISKMICRDGQSTITANIPFATFRITGLGDPVGAQDAATKNYVDGVVVWSSIGGLTTSRASATTLTVAVGKAADSTNAFNISLAAAMTKSTAGTWVAGSSNNGMGNGLTIANSTWYHAFLITNAGATDVYFDTSVTAANKPASTTAFRRIGSFKTNGSAQIIDYTQFGDLFTWAAETQDQNATALTISTPTNLTINVPLGIKTFWQGRLMGNCSTSGAFFWIDVYPVGQTSGAQAGAVGGGLGGAATNNNTGAASCSILTSTSQQVQAQASNSGCAISMNTSGWIDLRGKDV